MFNSLTAVIHLYMLYLTTKKTCNKTYDLNIYARLSNTAYQKHVVILTYIAKIRILIRIMNNCFNASYLLVTASQIESAGSVSYHKMNTLWGCFLGCWADKANIYEIF